MKLKCDKHNRRVVTVNDKFVHRNGYGDVCESPTATIGDRVYTPAAIRVFQRGLPIIVPRV